MPRPWAVALIILLWLGGTGWVLWAKVIRWRVDDSPPTVAFDIADEVRTQPTNWTVWRVGAKGQPDTKLGEMTTELKLNRADDTFQLGAKFPELKETHEKVPVKVTKVDLQTRVGRDGRLVSQYMTATCALEGQFPLSGTATVRAAVEAGELRGTCKIESSVGNITKDLPPVPVPAGQVLNPMMPVNRLVGVRPGKQWVIRHSDPLRDSISLLLNLPSEAQELLATVRDEPADFPRATGEAVSCWVIEYESRDRTIRAETWVERDGGRVFRQQARKDGDELRFDRQD